MIINGFDDETNTIHFDYDEQKKGEHIYRAPAIWKNMHDKDKNRKEKTNKIKALNEKLKGLKEAYKNCYFDPDHPVDSSQCKPDEVKTFVADTLRMFWFHGMPEKDEQNKKIQCKGIMLHEPGGFTKPQSLVDTLIKKDCSVHFFVDGETGSIYSCLPLNRRAAHCYKCDQPDYGKNHCTEGHCKNFDKTKKPIVWECIKKENCEYDKDKSKADDKQCKIKVKDKEENCKYLKALDRRPKSFNDSLLSIEICQSPDSEEGRTIYREKVLPAAVELCAQLCFLFQFDPMARTEKTVVKLEKYYGSTEPRSTRVKWDIITQPPDRDIPSDSKVYSVPNTLITHREGHIFYRQASNHSDPDTYWMDVFEGLKKDGSTEAREVIEPKSYGPSDFRKAVNEKLGEITKAGDQGWKMIHPYLLLLYSTCGYSDGNH